MVNESVDIQYTPFTEWNAGFQGSIDITNNGAASVEVESLDFDLPRNINNIWGANIVSSSGEDYTIETPDWNTEIRPGQTINIGFIGEGSGVIPENFDLETEGEGEQPTGEVPTEEIPDEGEQPTGEVPTEEIPDEGEQPTGEVPAEEIPDEGEQPTGEVPTEEIPDEGEQPTGEVPTEEIPDEGEQPTGEVPAEEIPDEGEQPTGEVPTEEIPDEGEQPTGEVPTEEIPDEGGVPTGEVPTGGDNPFVASTSSLSLGEVNQGRATFFETSGVRGNSGFDPLTGSAAAGIAAINIGQWEGSEASGAFIQVSGPEQRAGADPIIVQIADLLPDRADGLDLSPEAFAQIADPIDGIVDIDYELIDPGDDFRTPFGFTIGQGIVAEGVEGTNPFFAAVRFNNHRYPVESVELIEDDGDRIDFTRGSDNRFVLDGGFPINGAQDLEVTDIFGQSVILDDINITGGDSTTQITGEQFASI